MSLINSRVRYLLHTVCAVLLSQLLSVNVYGQDSYLEALASVAGDTNDSVAGSIRKSQIVNVEDDDRIKYQSQLFKLSSEYYNAFLDLGREQQNTVIKTFTSTNSMESSIDKLRALSGVQ